MATSEDAPTASKADSIGNITSPSLTTDPERLWNLPETTRYMELCRYNVRTTLINTLGFSQAEADRYSTQQFQVTCHCAKYDIDYEMAQEVECSATFPRPSGGTPVHLKLSFFSKVHWDSFDFFCSVHLDGSHLFYNHLTDPAYFEAPLSQPLSLEERKKKGPKQVEISKWWLTRADVDRVCKGFEGWKDTAGDKWSPKALFQVFLAGLGIRWAEEAEMHICGVSEDDDFLDKSFRDLQERTVELPLYR
jgi:hypothetical protein